MNDNFKSGFVTLVGRPNVGKSTLMNCLTGEKLAIVSNKPQTTRNRIQGILTNERCQIIFIDTPGIHKPKSKLGESMVKAAEASAGDADVILFLVEPDRHVHDETIAIAQKLSKFKNVFLVINKIDTVDKTAVLTVIDSHKELCPFAEIVPVSAAGAVNTDGLLAAIEKHLPAGPQYFPSDMITDQPERFIVSEIIREKALQLLQDELPHGIAVEIMSLKERGNKELIDIEATVYCEKESHKGMVIGKSGAMLKEIGSRARKDIAKLFMSPINLQIWVKVKKDWRDSDFYINSFGYGNR